MPNKDPSRIFLGGFSQGSGITLAAYLMYKGQQPIGGFIGVGGIQVLEVEKYPISVEQIEIQRETPLFLYHG